MFAFSQNQMSIEQFLKFSIDRKITRTEVFYLPFGADTFKPFDEEDLVAGASTVVVNGHIFQFYHPYIAKALENFAGQKMEKMPVNFRYCCLMYSGSDKAIRFSLQAPWPGGNPLWINGVPYKVDLNVIKAFFEIASRNGLRIGNQRYEGTAA